MSGKLRLEEGSVEPEAHNAYDADFDIGLCLQLSMAISLKRLADRNVVALVGERGPESVDLPNGSQIIPKAAGSEQSEQGQSFDKLRMSGAWGFSCPKCGGPRQPYRWCEACGPEEQPSAAEVSTTVRPQGPRSEAEGAAPRNETADAGAGENH